MAFALPNGSAVFIGSEMGEEIPVSAISNALGAVFTVAVGHGLSVDDVVLISSHWSLIDNLLARVSSKTETSVTIGVIDSSDEDYFAPGSDMGYLRKVTGWTEIPQITGVETSGGDQQFSQIQFLADDHQRNLATYKAAKSQVFTLAHDSDLPVYRVLKAADRSGETLPLRMFVPKAREMRYWSGSASFDPQPKTAPNEVETVQATFAIQSSDMTFYKNTKKAVGGKKSLAAKTKPAQ